MAKNKQSAKLKEFNFDSKKSYYFKRLPYKVLKTHMSNIRVYDFAKCMSIFYKTDDHYFQGMLRRHYFPQPYYKCRDKKNKICVFYTKAQLKLFVMLFNNLIREYGGVHKSLSDTQKLWLRVEFDKYDKIKKVRA